MLQGEGAGSPYWLSGAPAEEQGTWPARRQQSEEEEDKEEQSQEEEHDEEARRSRGDLLGDKSLASLEAVTTTR